MVDVFLSYKKEDATVAEAIVTALRAEGISVWWDDGLNPKESWDTEIEEMLASASTVVVLWSPRSIKSDWVRREAHYGQDRHKLVPVMVEICPIPIAFSLNQTVNLEGWAGDRQGKQWRKLLTWIADLVSTKPGNANIPQAISAAQPNRFRDVVGYLNPEQPIVDGGLVNASTPFGTLFRDGESLPVMRILPVGSFLLGASSNDPDRASYETPQRRIDIPLPFAIGVFPILVSEYQLATASPDGPKAGVAAARAESPVAPTPLSPRGSTVPVTGISFLEASTFAATISAATGEAYRVPSEAEWEYACRAGSRTRYWHGDWIDETHAAFGLSKGPVECGRFAPNAYGLYDMHGNVREWAADLWHDSFDSTPLDGRPSEEGHGSMRVVRGGGWSDEPAMLRSAARMRATQTIRSELIGMRLVRALGWGAAHFR